MKNLRVAVALIAGVTAVSPGAYAQSVQKPSSYSGVSQPPPDDTITSDAAPANPALTPPPVPAVSAAATNAIVAPAPPASVPGQAILATQVIATAPRQPCDSQDRMVGEPDPCLNPASETAATPKTAQLFAANDPSVDLVPRVAPRPGELPEATVIRLTLDQEISTGTSQVGADFSGRVSADVASFGRVVIPQGSQVLGKVVEVSEGHRFGSPATIRLRPDVVVLPDGSRYVLRAQVIDTSTKSRVGDEGTLKPASRLKKNVAEEAAGIGTGAVVGAVVGGGPGAIVGTLIGAGVMTTHILVQHPASVRIPRDSTLTLSLTQPMSISPEMASNAPGGGN